MDSIFSGMERIIFHVDNVLLVSYSGSHDYLQQLEKELLLLKKHNKQVRAEETLLPSTQFDFLGHPLAPNDIKPQEKKVKSSSSINRPKTLR